MSSHEPTHPLAGSGVTIHSDSEQYGEDVLTSSPSSSSPVVLYKPPTMWSLIRGTAINLVLPFINGMMLGFGELFAHEAAFRLGWGGTRVSYNKSVHTYDILCTGTSNMAFFKTKVFPLSRRRAHAIGPGIEIREKPRARVNLDDLTSLE